MSFACVEGCSEGVAKKDMKHWTIKAKRHYELRGSDKLTLLKLMRTLDARGEPGSRALRLTRHGSFVTCFSEERVLVYGEALEEAGIPWEIEEKE